MSQPGSPAHRSRPGTPKASLSSLSSSSRVSFRDGGTNSPTASSRRSPTASGRSGLSRSPSVVPKGAAPETGDGGRVRVAVRARPMNPDEVMMGAQNCVVVEVASSNVIIGKDRNFTFDYTYGPTSQQTSIYTECVAPLVANVLEGYNACVFAYGQTGSGKTYTMGTSNGMAAAEAELGVVPRAVRDLFAGMEGRKESTQCMVRVQFVEIYNEEIKDLLHPEVKPRDIQVRETPEGGITITGAKDEVVCSYEEAMRMLEIGMVSRTVGSTLMNEHSSRSHAIFTLMLEQQVVQKVAGQDGAEEVQEVLDYTTSKFHLVDLAGSERTKKTGAAGTRFKEAVNINQGLLCLGNVISALSDEKKRRAHVPYRDSKLTRMLQDSLGGNSKTIMIACVSTADAHIDESVNTLKYASRARTIKNRAVVNHAKNSLAALQAEVSALQLALLQRQMEDPNNPMHPLLLFGDLSQFINDPEMLGKLRLLAEGKLAPGEVMPWDPQGMASNASARAAVVPQAVNEVELRELQAKLEAAEGKAGGLESKLRSAESKLITSEGRVMTMQSRVSTAESRLKGADGELQALKSRIKALETDNRELLSQLTDVKGQLLSWVATMEVLHQDGNLSEEARERVAGIVDAMHMLLQEDRMSGIEAVPAPSARGIVPATAAITAGGAAAAANDWRSRRPVLHNRGSMTTIQMGPTTEELEEKVLELQRNLTTKQEEFGVKVADLSRSLADKDRTLAEVSIELAEAREDLARDEVIFEDKVKEVERLRSRNKELQGEVEVLKEHQVEMQELLRKLQEEDESSSSSEDDEDDKAGGSHTRDCSLMADAEAQTSGEVGAHGRSASTAQSDDCDSSEEGESEAGGIDPAALEERLERLQSAIQCKEGLIKQLASNEREARRLSRQYLGRMHELEEQINDKEGEVEIMRRDLESIESDMQKTAEEKNRMRASYEWKMNKVQSQMELLKKQLQEQQTAKVEKERQRAQNKIKALESDLQRMRQQYDNASLKLKAIHKQHSKASEEATRKMLALRRQADQKDKRMREIEHELMKQKNMVKRKHEEASLLQRKLKNVEEKSAQLASKLHSPKHLRRPSLTRPVSVQVGPTKTTTYVAGRKRTFHTRIPSLLRISLDKDIEKLLAQREASDKLDGLKRRMAAMASERDLKMAERSQLELKRMCEAQNVEALKHELELGMQELVDAIEDQAELAKKGDERAATEVLVLQQQLGTMRTQHAELEDKLATQELLSVTDEGQLREIEDRLDAIDTESEYVQAHVTECRKIIEEARQAEQSMRSRTNGDHNVHVIVQQCISALLRERETSRQHHSRALALESELAQQAQQRKALEHAVELKDWESGRRMATMQKDHTKVVQSLLNHSRRPSNEATSPSASAAASSAAAAAAAALLAGAAAVQQPAAAAAAAGPSTAAADDRQDASAAPASGLSDGSRSMASAVTAPEGGTTPADVAAAAAAAGAAPGPSSAPSSQLVTARGGASGSGGPDDVARLMGSYQTQVGMLDEEARYYKYINRQLKKQLQRKPNASVASVNSDELSNPENPLDSAASGDLSPESAEDSGSINAQEVDDFLTHPTKVRSLAATFEPRVSSQPGSKPGTPGSVRISATSLSQQ